MKQLEVQLCPLCGGMGRVADYGDWGRMRRCPTCDGVGRIVPELLVLQATNRVVVEEDDDDDDD